MWRARFPLQFVREMKTNLCLIGPPWTGEAYSRDEWISEERPEDGSAQTAHHNGGEERAERDEAAALPSLRQFKRLVS